MYWNRAIHPSSLWKPQTLAPYASVVTLMPSVTWVVRPHVPHSLLRWCHSPRMQPHCHFWETVLAPPPPPPPTRTPSSLQHISHTNPSSHRCNVSPEDRLESLHISVTVRLTQFITISHLLTPPPSSHVSPGTLFHPSGNGLWTHKPWHSPLFIRVKQNQWLWTLDNVEEGTLDLQRGICQRGVKETEGGVHPFCLAAHILGSGLFCKTQLGSPKQPSFSFIDCPH